MLHSVFAAAEVCRPPAGQQFVRMVCFIGSIASVFAIRRWKQSLTFIKTNRLNVHPRLMCKLADANSLSLGKKPVYPGLTLCLLHGF